METEARKILDKKHVRAEVSSTCELQSNLLKGGYIGDYCRAY